MLSNILYQELKKIHWSGYSKYFILADLLLRIFELILFVITGVVSSRIIFNIWDHIKENMIVLEMGILNAIIVANFFPVYQRWQVRSIQTDLSLLIVTILSIGIILKIQLYATPLNNGQIRYWIEIWLISAFTSILLMRTLFKITLQRVQLNGKGVERVIIVGIHRQIIKTCRYLKKNPRTGIQIFGYVKTPYDIRVSNQWEQEIHCLGDINTFEGILKKNLIDQVWVCSPIEEKQHTNRIFQTLDHYPVQVKWIPNLKKFGIFNQSTEQIGSIPAINLRQGGGCRDRSFRIIKALFDKLAAFVLITLLWPLLVIIAIGVKLSSPGPIFFIQKRQGLAGKNFNLLKFRSMYVQKEGNIVQQAQQGDCRVTRFGAFLRKTSLDELPQLLNVLEGNMSIVGPRPHAIQHNAYYSSLIQNYMRRHYVKPGITGWAQVNGYRGETPNIHVMKKRIQYDLDYISRWSIFFDLKIIMMTVVSVYNQKMAY